MDNLTEIVLIVIYLLLAGVFATVLFTAMAFNMRVGEMHREKMAKNLELLRMGRMLKALGIDTQQYLHNRPVVDIRRQMSTCAACDRTDTCDGELDTNSVDPDDIAYCPNESSLQGIRAERANSQAAEAGTVAQK